MKSNKQGPKSVLLCLAGATLAAVLTACGGPAEPAGPPEVTAAPSTAESRLTVLHRDGGEESTWQLTCTPPGGTHPDPQAACEVLDDNDGAALEPVDPGKMCTQVYAGPGTATVTGTWRGREVSSQFKLTNGCEISRWEALVGLLPPVTS